LLDFRLLSWHLLGKAEFDRYLLMLWALHLSCSVEWKWDCGRTGEGVNRGGCGFWEAFAKLRKATVSLSYLSPSVGPSVRMEQLDFHWADFFKIWCMSICRKCVDKI